MGIFRRKSTKEVPAAYSMMKALERKPIFEFKMLERFTFARIDEILENQAVFGSCRLIGETEKYWFYGFTPRLLQFVSNEYVLRRSKMVTELVQYFGESREITCVFGRWLCHADHDGSHPVLIKDIESGETLKYSWFRPCKSVGGHFVQYDYINRVFVDGSHLIFDVGRYKGDFHNRDDSYDYTTEYYLVVEWINGSFHTERQVSLSHDEVNSTLPETPYQFASHINQSVAPKTIVDCFTSHFMAIAGMLSNSPFSRSPIIPDLFSSMIATLEFISSYYNIDIVNERCSIVKWFLCFFSFLPHEEYDLLTQKIDSRIDFYRGRTNCGSIRGDFLLAEIPETMRNWPPYRFSIIFCDCCFNPACIDSYDDAPTLLQGIFDVADQSALFNTIIEEFEHYTQELKCFNNF